MSIYKKIFFTLLIGGSTCTCLKNSIAEARFLPHFSKGCLATMDSAITIPNPAYKYEKIIDREEETFPSSLRSHDSLITVLNPMYEGPVYISNKQGNWRSHFLHNISWKIKNKGAKTISLPLWEAEIDMGDEGSDLTTSLSSYSSQFSDLPSSPSEIISPSYNAVKTRLNKKEKAKLLPYQALSSGVQTISLVQSED